MNREELWKIWAEAFYKGYDSDPRTAAEKLKMCQDSFEKWVEKENKRRKKRIGIQLELNFD